MGENKPRQKGTRLKLDKNLKVFLRVIYFLTI